MNLCSVVFTTLCVLAYYGIHTADIWVFIAWGVAALLCGLVKFLAGQLNEN